MKHTSHILNCFLTTLIFTITACPEDSSSVANVPQIQIINDSLEINDENQASTNFAGNHFDQEYQFNTNNVEAIGTNIWVTGYMEDSGDSIQISFNMSDSIQVGTYDFQTIYEEFYSIQVKTKKDNDFNFFESRSATGYLQINSIEFLDYGTLKVVDTFDAEFEMKAINFATGKSDSLSMSNGQVYFKR